MGGTEEKRNSGEGRYALRRGCGQGVENMIYSNSILPHSTQYIGIIGMEGDGEIEKNQIQHCAEEHFLCHSHADCFRWDCQYHRISGVF